MPWTCGDPNCLECVPARREPASLLTELLFCLNEGFPAPVTAALLTLALDTSTLDEAWGAWEGEYDRTFTSFVEAVHGVTGDYVVYCDDCNEMSWRFNTTDVSTRHDEHRVCTSCLGEYRRCDCCDGWTTETTSVNDSYNYCDVCLEDRCMFCEACDSYFRQSDDHDHGCDCDAPHLEFLFPANGHGTITQNERFTVNLPAGTIDEQGMRVITDFVRAALRDSKIKTERQAFYRINDIVAGVGPLWQGKRGNFTKRLSAALYADDAKIKLPVRVLSEVGNRARAHSSEEAEWHIEVTRDLNEPAEHFFHEESCWWQSYAKSRCALKNWGGLALRTYTNPDEFTSCPSGRAWVQPLNAELHPTHDALNAHAYIVYNGYGALESYAPARLIAHLTSLTYRKVTFSADPQYINSGGYLIADEATCADTDAIRFEYDHHHTTDSSFIDPKAIAA